VPAIFGLIARCGDVAEAEMWEVFNMGCGFVVVVAEADAEPVAAALAAHHPGTARIGTVTDRAGRIERG
jgi:phosphoribosylformylglycinamidine cyclo-ligase